MSADADQVNLTYILECIDNIEELTAPGRAAFEAAKHHRAAVLYYLQTMAESTQRLSESLKAAHPGGIGSGSADFATASFTAIQK